MNRFIILLVIAVIEFNLVWTGFTHEPNWVKVWDTQGNEVQITEQRQSVGNGWLWEIYLNGEPLTYLGYYEQ